MSRLILIHSHSSDGDRRAEQLRRAGHDVHLLAGREVGPGILAARSLPPDVFIVDLERAPSSGRDAGTYLRRQKATRSVPIVFAGGEPDRVRAVRKLLPDATYSEWSRIRSAIRRAPAAAPGKPVVPGAMDAYAGAPLAKKLGVRAGVVMTLLGPPAGFEKLLGKLPRDVRVRRQARGLSGLIVLFVTSGAELTKRLPTALRVLADGGSLWIAWPKKKSKVSSDLTQTLVRRTCEDSGLVDFKICSIDDTWSGLRFAR